jgi:hypothetical protein
VIQPFLTAAEDRTVPEEDEAVTGETVEDGNESDFVVAETSAATSDLPDYVVANFAVPQGVEPHDVPVTILGPIVRRIIEIEWPVHQEEIARRVASLFGKQKAGSRIVAAVERSLRHVGRSGGDLSEQAGFWVMNGAPDVPLRNRSRAPVNLRRASLLPPSEIAEAIRKVLIENGALSWDELPRAVALLFGFQRTGPEFRPAVLPVIETMLADGILVEGAAGLELARS